MAKNEVIYQGLSDLNVLIDDTTANSPDYFRITNLPGEFTAGINIFKFKGNASLFPENSPLYIEVLDANGLPVYYEVGLDLESQEQSAIISVYINEDTVPGNGSITICGQANQSSEGQILDASDINVRWSAPVYIDISKRNVDEIIFDELPIVTITATTGSYTNLGYPGNTRTESDTWSNVSYIYRNGEATLYTSSLSFPAFPSTATNTRLTIYYGDIADSNQRTNEEIYTTAEFTSSILTYSGSGIAYLADPIIFSVNNSSEQHIVQYGVINTMDVVYEQSASLASQSTENTHNIAVVQFSGLQPQVGEIAKIRSYYKSAGVQEYIFSNETDISDLAEEFGFTANVVTASFALPTIHRNDKFDFKFEFINPSGYVSKQVLEYKDVLFQGGNTYIGGDDNLITGSLYVAGATGTGVHISGDGNAAMIRSIGYEGFAKASTPGGKGGFVIYSGSVQPLLNASEQYTGVGIELFANPSSYFKYTTSGSGLLDIRTDNFFLGSANQFVSGANGNIEISSSNFHLSPSGDVTIAGNITANTGNIGGFAITNNAITGSGFYLSGSATGNQFFISSSNFNVKASGDITGSSVLFTGGKIGSFTLTNNALSGISSGVTTFLISSSVDASNLSSAFFISSSKFNVRQDGTVSGSQVLFDGGKVGGFTIDSSKISGTNIVIDSAGSIQTADYAANLKGWKISAAGNGTAEFENAKMRGTLSTAVFEKTSVNAVGGQLYVANSTTLTGSSFPGASTTGNYSSTQTTMSVENVAGFEPGEILTAKKFNGTGFATEYLYINSASLDGDGNTNLSGRIYGNSIAGISSSLGESPSVGQSYSGSQVIVSTGKLGSGFIRINANPNDQATPYIDIVERTGSGIYDVALKARLGDLSGLANSSYVFGKSNPGFGLATDNVFLQGGIIANTGSIGGIKMESNKLFTGTGTYNNTNTGFYLDNNGQFSLKDKLSWNGTTLSITGNIDITGGNAATTAFVTSSIGTATSSLSSSINSTISTVSSSLNSSISSVSSSISSSVSSVSSSLTSTITSVSSSLNSSISSSVSSVSSSLTSTISSVSSSLTSTIISVSSSLNSSILAASSSAAAASSSAAIAIDRIVTDSNNKIVKPNNTPNAGAGLYLSENYLGHYSGSAWNSYISSSGEFLFKKDNNNQMSFGNNAFVLKVSDAATISGSNINLLTPNFFLGSNAQYISGSGGNIEISSSNFHLTADGDVNMTGDVNAVNGVFENALITGFVITGSGTAFSKASGMSSAFLLESWFTSSFERNLASGISSSSLTTKFSTGGTFNHGIFGWTASANFSASAASYTSVDGRANPLGVGYNMVGARYYGASQFEPKANNPGPPYNFLKWKQITGEYGDPYNGYGNEITASYFGGGEFACAPTVDSVIFLSPPYGGSVYSITSSLLTIPSASLGYSLNSEINEFVYNTNPISLQFSMRMMAAKAGGGSPPLIGTNPWSTDYLYKTYYGQVEIFDENNNILLTERKYFQGSADWQTFNLPLTPALAKITAGGLTIYNKFKIVLSWRHSVPEPFGGRYFPSTNTNLIRITELRLVQAPITLGLKTDSLTFQDSFLSSGNSGTQHYGAFYPLQDDTYDLGTPTQQWKSLYSNTSSLGIATIDGGIKNPTNDALGLGYDNKSSLTVWDGESNVWDEVYNPALEVTYEGDVYMYKKAMVGGGPLIGAAVNPWAALTISGSIAFDKPYQINEFNGEIYPGLSNYNAGTHDRLGDIFFLKSSGAGAPGYFASTWELASATNTVSGSGLLAVGIGRPYVGAPIDQWGTRGFANFTGSSYQLVASASGIHPGDKLYLSTTPGKFQNWAPTGSGEVIRIIGYCVNGSSSETLRTGSIYFAPETSWIENV